MSARSSPSPRAVSGNNSSSRESSPEPVFSVDTSASFFQSPPELVQFPHIYNTLFQDGSSPLLDRQNENQNENKRDKPSRNLQKQFDEVEESRDEEAPGARHQRRGPRSPPSTTLGGAHHPSTSNSGHGDPMSVSPSHTVASAPVTPGSIPVSMGPMSTGGPTPWDPVGVPVTASSYPAGVSAPMAPYPIGVPTPVASYPAGVPAPVAPYPAGVPAHVTPYPGGVPIAASVAYTSVPSSHMPSTSLSSRTAARWPPASPNTPSSPRTSVVPVPSTTSPTDISPEHLAELAQLVHKVFRGHAGGGGGTAEAGGGDRWLTEKVRLVSRLLTVTPRHRVTEAVDEFRHHVRANQAGVPSMDLVGAALLQLDPLLSYQRDPDSSDSKTPGPTRPIPLPDNLKDRLSRGRWVPMMHVLWGSYTVDQEGLDPRKPHDLQREVPEDFVSHVRRIDLMRALNLHVMCVATRFPLVAAAMSGIVHDFWNLAFAHRLPVKTCAAIYDAIFKEMPMGLARYHVVSFEKIPNWSIKGVLGREL
ncbi:uncharacterized protein LOC143037961 isoform X3 [Oratosquilla oratoria]